MLQDTPRTSMTVRALGGAAVLALIAGGSIEILPPAMRAMITSGTLDSFLAVLPYTLGPALRVWAFWAIVTVVAGAALLRLAPELGALDAALAGAIVPWVFAYVGGNLLGPVGLFRSWTLWAIVAAIAVWVWGAMPRIVSRAPPRGMQLALLAVAIAALGIIPLRPGSRV